MKYLHGEGGLILSHGYEKRQSTPAILQETDRKNSRKTKKESYKRPFSVSILKKSR